MRCTQIYGLTKEAEKFLEKNAKRVPKKTCPTCKHTSGGGLKKVVYDKKTGVRAGMFDDGPELFEYTLKGKKGIVSEIVQEVPWDSGPCIYLCLVDENGNHMFEWTDEEMFGEDYEDISEEIHIEDLVNKLDIDKEAIKILGDLAINNEEVNNLCCNWYYVDEPEIREEIREKLLKLVEDFKKKSAREK